jgi:hypothetical protein
MALTSITIAAPDSTAKTLKNSLRTQAIATGVMNTGIRDPKLLPTEHLQFLVNRLPSSQLSMVCQAWRRMCFEVLHCHPRYDGVQRYPPASAEVLEAGNRGGGCGVFVE